MKNKFKVCSIIILIVLTMTCIVGFDIVRASDRENVLLPDRISEKTNKPEVNRKSEEELIAGDIEKLKVADESFWKLWEYFNKLQDETGDEDSYSVSGLQSSAFPIEYAGAYINENLDLVVLINKKNFDSEEKLIEICRKYEEIVGNKILYSSAKYSYCEMVNEMDKISHYINENKDNSDYCCDNINCYEVDDYNNCINVGLKNLDDKSIELFKKCISESAMIKFYKNDSEYEEVVAFVRAGEKLSCSGYNCSIGFPARKYENGSLVKGFVTAGHAVSAGSAVYWSGQQIATADSSLWQNSGTVDAVFCKLNSTSSILNQVAVTNESLANAIDVNLAVGHPVKAVGFKTGGSSGTILSMSVSASGMQDLVKADYFCQNGDSGGIVVSTRTGSNYIAGIITSRISSYSYYTKATNIMNAFGLTLNN